MFPTYVIRRYRIVVPHVVAWTLLIAMCGDGFGYPAVLSGVGRLQAARNDNSSGAAGTEAVRRVTMLHRLNGTTFHLQQIPLHTDFDFDGDRRADVAMWRPADGIWLVSQSSTRSGGVFSAAFGQQGDTPVPADYDGDGRMNFAVWRGGNGTWYIRRPDGSFYGMAFGQQGDIPVPADYDGDGKADIAVLRPSVSSWFIVNSSDGRFVAHQFGLSEDIPVPADYDGDSRTDIAVFRPSDHTWYIRRPDGSFYGLPFGMSGDVLVPADYDGDGESDIGVYRPSDGSWYTLQRQQGCSNSLSPCDTQPKDKVVVANLNSPSPNLDFPVPADYDGDRKADFALWRDGVWTIRYSRDETTSEITLDMGATDNIPLPSVYTRRAP